MKHLALIPIPLVIISAFIFAIIKFELSLFFQIIATFFVVLAFAIFVALIKNSAWDKGYDEKEGGDSESEKVKKPLKIKNVLKETFDFGRSLLLFVAFIFVALSMGVHGWKAYKNLTTEKTWITVGTLSYTPNKTHWTRASATLTLDDPGICIIECSQGYNQYFDNEGRTLPIRCSGTTMVDTSPEDRRFKKMAQLIRITGKTYVEQTEPFECSSTVTAEFLPNMDKRAENDFINNTGKAVFEIKKLIKNS